MSEITKTYRLCFMHPGLFVGETSRVDCGESEPDLTTIEWPESAYAVQVEVTHFAAVNGETYTRNETGKLYYHPDSKIATVDEVRARRPNETTLIANMECNKWDRVIWTRHDRWPQPFDPERMEILGGSKVDR